MASKQDRSAKRDGQAGEPQQPQKRKQYVKPRIEETEPLENVTLLSGGVNPTTANPFVQ